MRVLLADDDPICRAVVARALSAWDGIEIVEAADGTEAITLLKRYWFFQLAILDWRMPGKNGLEIVKLMRAAGLDVPVLMVTVESDKQRVTEAIRAGVSDYLIKPFDLGVLLSKLDRFLCRGG